MVLPGVVRKVGYSCNDEQIVCVLYSFYQLTGVSCVHV